MGSLELVLVLLIVAVIILVQEARVDCAIRRQHAQEEYEEAEKKVKKYLDQQ